MRRVRFFSIVVAVSAALAQGAFAADPLAQAERETRATPAPIDVSKTPILGEPVPVPVINSDEALGQGNNQQKIKVLKQKVVTESAKTKQSRGDDAESKPLEVKPLETKPHEANAPGAKVVPSETKIRVSP